MATHDMDFLLELGFEEAGVWVMADGQPLLRLTKHGSETSVLYAFAAAGQVLYIGKSVRSLRNRLYGYQRPGPTQRTNIRNRGNLRQALLQGQIITVLALVAREQIMYRGIAINVAAGLEDVLIDRLRPPWNRVGTCSPRDAEGGDR